MTRLCATANEYERVSALLALLQQRVERQIKDHRVRNFYLDKLSVAVIERGDSATKIDKLNAIQAELNAVLSR